MPTSAAGTSNSSGFTLIELVVVLAILAMTTLLVLPRLPDTRGAALKASARTLATTIRYIEDQAVVTRQPFRLRIAPGEGKVTVSTFLPSGTESPPGDTIFSRPILAEGVVVSDVQTPRLGTVTSGEVLIDIDQAGLADVTVFHLREERGSQMTVTAYPFGGRVKVLEGYQEVTP